RSTTPGGPAPRFFGNQDGPEIVDVGERWPGHDGVAERFEEAVAVVVVEALLGLDTLGPGAREAIGREICAGDIFHTVDAVGISRHRVNARTAIQRDPE